RITTETKTPGPSAADKDRKNRPASAPASHEMNSEGLAHSRGLAWRSWPAPLFRGARTRCGASGLRHVLIRRRDLGSEAQVVREDAQQTSDDGNVSDPLERLLPEAHRPRNVRVSWQASVKFGIAGIVEDIDNVSAFDSGWIVDSGVCEAGMIAKLSRARFREFLHFGLGAEVQAAGRTRLNAGGLQALRNPVHAKRALENL